MALRFALYDDCKMIVAKLFFINISSTITTYIKVSSQCNSSLHSNIYKGFVGNTINSEEYAKKTI